MLRTEHSEAFACWSQDTLTSTLQEYAQSLRAWIARLEGQADAPRPERCCPIPPAITERIPIIRPSSCQTCGILFGFRRTWCGCDLIAKGKITKPEASSILADILQILQRELEERFNEERILKC